MPQVLFGLPAVVGTDPRVLILGSMPGEESLRQQQYYAHPRNAFWDILGELVGAGRDHPYERRLTLLALRGIAVWDVAHSCVRPGSLDASIRDPEANDLAGFLAWHPTIRAVFFNGRKAADLFERLVRPGLSRDADRMVFATLPSTSPANARLSRAGKTAEWNRILEHCRPGP